MQLDPDETEDECIMTYSKFFLNSGFSDNLPFTNSITYDDFRNGYYFCVFDLSTSSRSTSSGLIPSVRVGHLRLKVLFSDGIPFDLTCLMHAEFPSAIFLNKGGKVSGTFI